MLSKEFYEARAADIAKRVSKKRLIHIEGVSATAAKLAEIYGVDVASAALAGLLHDWDKGLDDDEIRERVHELGMEDEVGSWTLEHMPRVLHGPTAARALSREFPEIPDEIISAIYKHTTAACEMSPLDKVIYIADAIEPSRTFHDIDQLRAQVGVLDLDALFFKIYKFWTMALVKHNVVLHPDTVTIWNEMAQDQKTLQHMKGRDKPRRE